MPSITVYKDKKEIRHEPIKQEYYIIETVTGELVYSENQPAGIIRLWLHSNNKDSFMFHFVLPDWQLIIDGIWFEKKLYLELDINGKNVEVHHKEYRFMFQFD